MTDFITGFPEFGSGDSAHLLECALTDSTDIAAKGGTLQTGADVNANGIIATGTFGAVQFDFTTLDQTSLDRAGFISCEIDSSALSVLDSTVGSIGNTYSTVTVFLHWNEVDDVTLPYGRICILATGIIRSNVHTGDTARDAGMHSATFDNKTAKVIVTWNGYNFDTYIDGYKLWAGHRITAQPAELNYMKIGAYLSATGQFTQGRTKNLIIGNRPIIFSSHPQMANVYVWGDSFVDQATQAGSPNNYNAVGQLAFEAYMRNQGLNVSLNVSGWGGYSISDGTTSSLDGGTGNPRVTLLSYLPDVVIIQAGVNDANDTTVPTTFDTDYKDHISTLIAGGVKKVIVCTIPKLGGNSAWDSQTYINNVAEVNGYIKALPDWWDTNNPTSKGMVGLADVFTAFGGWNPISDVFIGQVNGLNNNNHPSCHGHHIMGKTWAEALLETFD